MDEIAEFICKEWSEVRARTAALRLCVSAGVLKMLRLP